MSKAWTGRLEHVDIEGGAWMLHSAGRRYSLRGEVPSGLAGHEVVVEGEPDESFGFLNAGPAIAVRSVRKR